MAEHGKNLTERLFQTALAISKTIKNKGIVNVNEARQLKELEIGTKKKKKSKGKKKK